jgi:hypothetical protein
MAEVVATHRHQCRVTVLVLDRLDQVVVYALDDRGRALGGERCGHADHGPCGLLDTLAVGTIDGRCEARATGFQDRDVEIGVLPHGGDHVGACYCSLGALQERLHLAQLLLRPFARGALRSLDLDEKAEVVDVLDVVGAHGTDQVQLRRRQLHHEGALAGSCLHQAEVRQHPQRLADRGTADAELASQVRLRGQALSRRVGAVADGELQCGQNLVREIARPHGRDASALPRGVRHESCASLDMLRRTLPESVSGQRLQVVSASVKLSDSRTG